MIVLTWKKTDPFLTAFGKQIPCACPVRNEINGKRGRCELIYSMPDHLPYYPRVFPNGIWTLGPIVPSNDRLTTPFQIKTDAWQMVDTWEQNANHCYTKKTGKQVKDMYYNIHMLNCGETWGCIGIKSFDLFVWMLDALRKNIRSQDLLQISVTED